MQNFEAMNDWLAYCDKKNKFTFSFGSTCIEHQGIVLFETGGCRFTNDHLFCEDEKLIIVVDGVLVNLAEMLKKYGQSDLLHLLKYRYGQQPNNFFAEWRGQFTGLVFDKQNNQGTVFTNQTGDSAVFVYQNGSTRVFASNFYQLSQFLKENNLPTHFSSKAAHWMLTFGYMPDDSTFIEEVKRLQPGKAFCFNDGHFYVETYHRFVSGERNISEDEAINRIEQLFTQAVRRCFDKDLEYGCSQHLADMSAGLDSRMTTVVARSLGYEPITSISYSQLGSEEERLARKAAEHFGNHFIFKALDDHQFIFDIDNLTKKNFGTYLYTGITGGNELLSTIDFSRFGAEHTGQLGDIIISTFVKGKSNDVDPEAVRLSHIIEIGSSDPNPDNLPNQDVYSLYTRGFQGALSSWFVRKNYTFALSPFTDVDLMEFCYSLPVEMRKNHNLYWKWIERYHPEALEVESSRKRKHVFVFELVKKVWNKGMKVLRLIGFKLGILKSRVGRTSSMNPYDYWYDTDPNMRTFIQSYFDEHINSITNETTLNELKIMFNSNKMLDKLMALTVLSARKVFF